jgi:hypothetical protein
MSIFKDVWNHIKNIASHIFQKIAHGDEAAADEIELTATNVATLINNIKGYIESPMGDFLVNVIPGTWDNDLKVKATEFLNKVIAQESILMNCLQEATIGEQIVCIYSKIEGLNDESQTNSFWHKLGVLGTEIFSDGKLSFSDSILAIEFLYRLIFKKDTSLVTE